MVLIPLYQKMIMMKFGESVHKNRKFWLIFPNGDSFRNVITKTSLLLKQETINH